VTVLDKVRGEAHAHPVVARVQVFEVGRDSSLTPSSTSTDAAESTRGAIANVTLAVTEDQARELAEARRLGDLDVVLLPVPDSSAE
jgi:Flp pilus assembly protein CpaB